jgi:hypothetical protein
MKRKFSRKNETAFDRASTNKDAELKFSMHIGTGDPVFVNSGRKTKKRSDDDNNIFTVLFCNFVFFR